MSQLINNPEIAYEMLDIKRALDKCSLSRLIEEKEYVENNNECGAFLKTATLQEINRQIQERR